MATISTLDVSGTTHPTVMMNRPVYVVENYINWADAATAKGSALASADVIEALTVPAGTLVLQAGFEVTSVATGESSDVTLDLGVTGVDADLWVDGFDLDAAAAGAFGTLVGDAGSGAGAGPVLMFASADTIDVLIATATTAPTGGAIRVFAVLCDVSEKALKQPTIAQLKS
jgi:hypothetical protein